MVVVLECRIKRLVSFLQRQRVSESRIKVGKKKRKPEVISYISFIVNTME